MMLRADPEVPASDSRPPRAGGAAARACARPSLSEAASATVVDFRFQVQRQFAVGLAGKRPISRLGREWETAPEIRVPACLELAESPFPDSEGVGRPAGGWNGKRENPRFPTMGMGIGVPGETGWLLTPVALRYVVQS